MISREAKDYELGESKYYVVLVGSAIMWQFFFLGAIGVIFCSSSLFSGIIIAAFLPVTEVLGVIVYKEKFEAEKGVALVLSLWGFVSYFYGEIKEEREKNKNGCPETELPQSLPPNAWLEVKLLSSVDFTVLVCVQLSILKASLNGCRKKIKIQWFDNLFSVYIELIIRL